MPKISVLMPVYNTEEEYLREAIESILNQTFTDFEFIIINDGSDNNAEDVILSYNDKHIKYIKKEKNQGLIETLNEVLEIAQGEYIARMDSDDVSLPERFEKQVNFLDKNPDVDVLGTWFNCFPRNRVVKTFTNDKNIKECFLINSNNIGHPTVMLRKATFEKLNARYDENATYVEDYALWLSLIDKVKFANLPEILLNYRIHKKSICKTKNVEQSLNIQKIMVIAQGKYFDIKNEKVLEAIEKLKNGKSIVSKELLAINDFSIQVKTKAENLNFTCSYDINKDFYKYAVKKCKRDILFLKLLWTSKLNKLLRLRLDFKIFNSLRFASKHKNQLYSNVNSPKVSAVMALYNTPYKYLEKTLKSLLNQTFTDFELIVVDDASKIDYKKFFEKINDKRIKYFKLENNSGPGHARNEGIKKALGEYVAIVDSDDIYMQNRFQLQVDFLNNNPDISLLSGVLKFSKNHKIASVVEKDEDIKVFMLFNSALTNAAAMFRKDIFLEKNLFYPENINFGEDYALWLDAMFSGIKMANLKDTLMIYVRRNGQLSKARIDKQINILKELYKKIFEKIGIIATEEEINLHYDIYTEKFKGIKDINQIINWMDKIIVKNKTYKFFEEQSLLNKKEKIVEKYNKIKNRLLKIKIGGLNLCLSKKLQIYLEKRD